MKNQIRTLPHRLLKRSILRRFHQDQVILRHTALLHNFGETGSFHNEVSPALTVSALSPGRKDPISGFCRSMIRRFESNDAHYIQRRRSTRQHPSERVKRHLVIRSRGASDGADWLDKECGVIAGRADIR